MGNAFTSISEEAGVKVPSFTSEFSSFLPPLCDVRGETGEVFRSVSLSESGGLVRNSWGKCCANSGMIIGTWRGSRVEFVVFVACSEVESCDGEVGI